MKEFGVGVADGARSHDNRNHNPDKLVFATVDLYRYTIYKSTTYMTHTGFTISYRVDPHFPIYGKSGYMVATWRIESWLERRKPTRQT